MKRQLIIRPEAESEMTDAFDWYEEYVPGLGSELLLTANTTFESILHNPEQFPIIHDTVRRALLQRFPYGVYFVLEPEQIVVIAFFHGKRNPKRWQERM